MDPMLEFALTAAGILGVWWITDVFCEWLHKGSRDISPSDDRE